MTCFSQLFSIFLGYVVCEFFQIVTDLQKTPYLLKKIHVKWTGTVQIHVQGSTVIATD